MKEKLNAITGLQLEMLADCFRDGRLTLDGDYVTPQPGPSVNDNQGGLRQTELWLSGLGGLEPPTSPFVGVSQAYIAATLDFALRLSDDGG